jgi:threonyl-tRNA synthetase
MGILIEHFAGRFPLWLAPTQVVVTGISGDQDDYVTEIYTQMKALGIRVELDLRNEKINYKVREHSHAKIPAIFVVGGREAEQKTVTVRRLGSKAQETFDLKEAIDNIIVESIAPDLRKN